MSDPTITELRERLAAAEERAEKAETDLSDERAAHLVLASSLETQRQISRDTVGRAVEMERQRNDLRVRLAAAEADRDALRELIETWIDTRARIGARVTFADQALRDGFRSWKVGQLVPHGR